MGSQIRWTIFALCIAVSNTSRAQQASTAVRIRIDTGPDAPISSALVALVDSQQVVAEGLTTTHGTIVLSAPPGSYRIKVRRIGFRPFMSDPVTLPYGGELSFRVETEHIVLDQVVVSATAHCGNITRNAAALSIIWEEIEKALRSSRITANDLSAIKRMKRYNRETDLNGNVTSGDSASLPVGNARPFAAVDPASLPGLGYVRGDAQKGWDYFGPDEAVLLSDGFAATHCFKVVRDEAKRAGQIGVAFTPAPGRRISDIKGVLWVDEKTSELIDTQFTYVNAGILSRFVPGGFTRFTRMPSGAWIVSEWNLRMPRLELRTGPLGGVSPIGYVETGGIVETSRMYPQ